MRYLILVVTLAAGLAACVQTPAETAAAAQDQQATQAKLSKALAGLVPGQPMSCIPDIRPSLQTQAYGATLLYRVSNGLVYRNDTSGGCEGAARGDILVTKEYEGRPCRGDIVRTVQPVANIPTGSCSLGDFVPYRKP